MQGTVGNPQITRYLRNALATGPHQAHRLLFKFLRKRSLVFQHLGFPFLTKYIQVRRLFQTEASPECTLTPT